MGKTIVAHTLTKGLRLIFTAVLLAALAFSLMPAMVAEAAQRTVTNPADDGSAGTLIVIRQRQAN